MARDYARIMTAIWSNADFCRLHEPAQRLYLLLVTQKDISAAGVLHLRMRHWSDLAPDSTPDRTAQTLKELESGRFIVIDWDKEEVLIRSFIRWDAGYNNPKRRPVIVKAAADADSPIITRCLMIEFQRCGIPTSGPPDDPASAPVDSQSDSHAYSQSDGLSDAPDPASPPLPSKPSLRR